MLYRVKTHSKTVRLALALLALGMDISSLEEAIEIRECTLRVWLFASGPAKTSTFPTVTRPNGLLRESQVEPIL